LTSGGTVTPGGDIVGTNAHGYGSGIFIQGDNTIAFSPASGDAQILNDQIADQTGNGGTGGNAGHGSVTMNGAGTLVVSGANTYTGTTTISTGIFALVNVTGSATGTGSVNVETGARLSGRGATAGTVNLLGGILSPDSDQRLALGALLWHGGSTVAASIGSSATVPVQITGALEKGSPGIYTIALTDAGVTPGQTYTLMTFASNAGFTASDFTVTGVSGSVSLTATELRFTATALPPVYGVTLAAAKGKGRATFTLTNTGDTTTGFRLAKLARITGGGKPGPTPPKPGKPPVELVYLLDGANITSALVNGTATAPLAPGATAQILVKVKTRGAHKQRTIRVGLSATSVADPSVSATAKTSFVLKADR
jgi:autotransporter-associated beta strand protein